MKRENKPQTEEVAIVDHGAVSTGEIDFLADAGQGLEQATSSDFQMPFLAVLQSNSPQVKRGDAKYIDGAKAGDFLNTVTGETYDGEKGVLFIPCHYYREVIEWKPRNLGGGMIGRHPAGSLASLTASKNAKNVPLSAAGNELRDTAYHPGLLVDGKNVTQINLSFTSTQLKKTRRWLSTIASQKIPGKGASYASFAQIYRLRLVSEQNNEGTWYGLHITFEGIISDPQIYTKAREFYGLWAAGMLQVGNVPQDAQNDAPAGVGADDDNTPF